ncbi:MAG: YciI family protein [Commensalibacter sp.]|nr:YciI family protein [Commensalibacter sp.]
MMFMIMCTDKPGLLETRMAIRPQHLAYLQAYEERILVAGPLQNEQGKSCGSLILIEVPDRAAAEGFAISDPYAKADLFESVIIRPFKQVIKDGSFIENKPLKMSVSPKE